MLVDEFNFDQLSEKLGNTLDFVIEDLKSLRTGKATPQLLDSVQVEVYDSQMKITELANVSAPDPTLLVITPWDKSIMVNIEKAIAEAQLNMNPVVDGDLIRISIPQLTAERRQEMVKILNQKIESGKKMMRNVRIDSKQAIEKLKGSDGISEDDIEANLEQLETVFKEYLKKLDDFAAKKTTDLLTV